MIKIYRFFILFSSVLWLTSCVQDDDFSIPDDLGKEENKGLEQLLLSGATEISIADLKAKLAGNDFNALEIDTDIYIKGYVSSSDRTGNFFKEIFLQDAPENPTSGLKIIINQVKTYNQYNLGREVYIKLKGLYLGEERVGNGITTIGGATETNSFGTAVKRLTENQRVRHLFRSETTASLKPLNLNFSQVSAKHIGLYVQFDDVEFVNNLSGKRYFDPTQDFDTLRQLQSCTGTVGYSNFTLITSSFATFKDNLLPTGNGTVSGVVTKTFEGDALVLELNDVSDVSMASDRCMPLTIEDFDIIYREDFESAASNKVFSFAGWTNFIEAGNPKWREKNLDGNGYAEFSSFNSYNPSNIAWLITPGFDMDAHNNEYLKFKAAQHHVVSPNNTLEVMVSTDFDGTNVLEASWTIVEASLPSPDTSWYQFVDSGLIDLSNYSGTLHIAFRVTGSGTNESLAGAYQIDDLVILAKD